MKASEILGLETNLAGIIDFTVIGDSINFNFFPQALSSGLVIYRGDYNYSGNEYNFNYKLIPNKPGLYLLEHGSFLMDISNNTPFDGKCNNKLDHLDADFKMNNGNENNINMLSSSPIEHFNTWKLNDPPNRYHRFGGYCFYVKE